MPGAQNIRTLRSSRDSIIQGIRRLLSLLVRSSIRIRSYSGTREKTNTGAEEDRTRDTISEAGEEAEEDSTRDKVSEAEEEEGADEESESDSNSIAPRRSTRIRTNLIMKVRESIKEDYFNQSDYSAQGAYITSEGSIIVLNTKVEALASKNKSHWEEVITTKVAKLQSLNTWKVVDLPKVFAVKLTPSGLIDRFKARLVAQGFSQRLGEDYLETFSPTLKIESLPYPRAELYAKVYIRPTEALRKAIGIINYLIRAETVWKRVVYYRLQGVENTRF
ncbi:uncharacterized protein RAG0_14967 [Rhynchosporium agropyri]|uniref:Reverse transcriptase Ty1/copia-type domain-containing protein n=1 Tax=Rhynchosporium agropyri TaxID=914238 RepID=A0A1E1LJ59_9HELO|nr:uncharacterized protein RAG0_14967 [Rhynchosporium agropyri]